MKYKKSVYKSLAMITQLGISMLVPIFLCSFIGYLIDQKFNSYFFVPLFMLGALAGFRNVYIMTKSIYSDEKESKSEEKDK